jgi:hypothetical protein
MRTYPGWVAEVQLQAWEAKVLIACPREVIPATGQYLLAIHEGAIQPTPLFLSNIWNQGFLAAPPYPNVWRPGTELALYGPLGRGFHLPGNIQRLALIAFGDTNARLLPLLDSSISNQYSVALFSDAPFGGLAPDLEVFPLNDLQESFSWADFYAIDSPLDRLELFIQQFINSFRDRRALRGQILVHASMPCSTLGECGICAVKVKRSWKLACKDGPVFDLQDILKGVDR